jgi:hypothetical protein
MSKKQIKQSTQLTDIEVPPEIALSLLKPDELEKLERYVSMYKDRYGLKDEAETWKSKESKELPKAVLIAKPFLVKLQSGAVEELATLHCCTLRLSEAHQGSHIVTFPVGTRLSRGMQHVPSCICPMGISVPSFGKITIFIGTSRQATRPVIDSNKGIAETGLRPLRKS